MSVAIQRFDPRSGAATEVLRQLAKENGVALQTTDGGQTYARISPVGDGYEMRLRPLQLFADVEIDKIDLMVADASDAYALLERAIEAGAAELRGRVALGALDGPGRLDFVGPASPNASPAERPGLQNSRALRIAERLALEVQRLLRFAADESTPGADRPTLAVARDAYEGSGPGAAALVLVTAGIDPRPHLERWRATERIRVLVGESPEDRPEPAPKAAP